MRIKIFVRLKEGVLDPQGKAVERVIAPDATILLDFMLRRMTYVLRDLVVYPQNMRRNLDKSGGAIYSERVLLRLVGKGLARDRAYRMVQRHALAVTQYGGDLRQALLDDPEIRRYLTAGEIREIWDLKPYLKNVDAIFKRVFS